jgi:hypothetical protein
MAMLDLSPVSNQIPLDRIRHYYGPIIHRLQGTSNTCKKRKEFAYGFISSSFSSAPEVAETTPFQMRYGGVIDGMDPKHIGCIHCASNCRPRSISNFKDHMHGEPSFAATANLGTSSALRKTPFNRHRACVRDSERGGRLAGECHEVDATAGASHSFLRQGLHGLS